MANVQRDNSFSVALQPDPSVVATGVVREIAPQADAATRTRRIKLTLDRAPDVCRLGTTVTIALETAALPTIVVPASAILEKDGRTSVWLATQDGKVAARVVVVATREGDRVTVKEGLVKGDRVITAGVHSLSDGQAIRVEPQS